MIYLVLVIVALITIAGAYMRESVNRMKKYSVLYANATSDDVYILYEYLQKTESMYPFLKFKTRSLKMYLLVLNAKYDEAEDVLVLMNTKKKQYLFCLSLLVLCSYTESKKYPFTRTKELYLIDANRIENEIDSDSICYSQVINLLPKVVNDNYCPTNEEILKLEKSIGNLCSYPMKFYFILTTLEYYRVNEPQKHKLYIDIILHNTFTAHFKKVLNI